MPDIFDQIGSQKQDIFDRIFPPKVDIFDQVSPPITPTPTPPPIIPSWEAELVKAIEKPIIISAEKPALPPITEPLKRPLGEMAGITPSEKYMRAIGRAITPPPTVPEPEPSRVQLKDWVKEPSKLKLAGASVIWASKGAGAMIGNVVDKIIHPKEWEKDPFRGIKRIDAGKTIGDVISENIPDLESRDYITNLAGLTARELSGYSADVLTNLLTPLTVIGIKEGTAGVIRQSMRWAKSENPTIKKIGETLLYEPSTRRLILTDKELAEQYTKAGFKMPFEKPIEAIKKGVFKVEKAIEKTHLENILKNIEKAPTDIAKKDIAFKEVARILESGSPEPLTLPQNQVLRMLGQGGTSAETVINTPEYVNFRTTMPQEIQSVVNTVITKANISPITRVVGAVIPKPTVPEAKITPTDIIAREREILIKSGIPKIEMPKYIRHTEANGEKLRVYTEDVIAGKITEGEAIRKITEDYEKVFVDKKMPEILGIRIEKLRELKAQASRRAVTGLYGARARDVFLERSLKQSELTGEPTSLIALDVDNFKALNTKYGYTEANKILKHIGEALTKEAGAEGVPINAHGDEFQVIMKGTLETAQAKGSSLQTTIKTYLTEKGYPDVSVSIGAATRLVDGKELEAIQKDAEARLKEAKAVKPAVMPTVAPTVAPVERLPAKEGIIAKPQEIAKEPYQMTLDELNRTGYIGYDIKLKKPIIVKKVGRIDESANASEHKRIVAQALAEGKTVPAEVLADYPELQKQVKLAVKKVPKAIRPPTPALARAAMKAKKVAKEAPYILEQINEQGGLKPYRDRTTGKTIEYEEFSRNVPLEIRNAKTGKQPDEMAEVLGFSSDTELYEKIQTAIRSRKIMEEEPPFETIVSGHLKIGDKFTRQGEEYRVAKKTAEHTYLQDDERIEVKNTEEIEYDTGSFVYAGKPKKIKPFLNITENQTVTNTQGKEISLKTGEPYRIENLGKGRIRLTDGKKITVYEGELKNIKGEFTDEPNIAAGGITQWESLVEIKKDIEKLISKNEMSLEQNREFEKTAKRITKKDDWRDEAKKDDLLKVRKYLAGALERKQIIEARKLKAGRKERGFIKTVKTSPMTSQELKKLAGEIEPRFYKPLTNPESINKARIIIAENPDIAKERVLSVEPPSAEKSALAIELMKKYENEKNFEAAGNILKNYDTQLRDAGQFIQAASLWNKMSPTGMVKMVERTAKKLEIELGEEVKKAIFDKMVEIQKMPEGMEKDKATMEVLNYVADKLPLKFGELFEAYRYQNMLSSPRSHERNIWGNTLQTLITRPLDLVSEWTYDMFKHPFNPAARDIKISAVPKYYQGVFKSIPEAIGAFREGLRSGSISGKILEISRPKDIKGATMIEALRRQKVPLYLSAIPRFMEAQDRFFSILIASGEKANLMAKEISETEAMTDAKTLAEKYLYRERLGLDTKNQSAMVRALDGLGNFALKGRNLPVVGKAWAWFVPFVRTPINITKMGVERTPFGFIGGDYSKEQISKAFLGSVITAIGALLALQDRTSWSPPQDPELKKLYYDSGRKPYSILIKGKWIPLWYFGPYAFPLALPAAVKHFYTESKTNMTDNDVEKIIKAIASIAKFITSQTPLSGMSSFMQAIEGDIDYSLPGVVARTAGQAIPFVALNNYINQWLDPVFRKSPKFIDSLKKAIPGMTKDLPPFERYDGTPAERKQWNLLLPYDIGIADKQWLNMYLGELKVKQLITKEAADIKEIEREEVKIQAAKLKKEVK